MFHSHLPRIISGILSLLQASDLRNRMYSQQERIEILETALEDINRIANSNAAVEHRIELIKNLSKKL